MKRKYTRKNKRRSFRKRRSIMPIQRYFKQKCTEVIPLGFSGDAPTDRRFGFSWQQPSAIATNVFGFNATKRWGQCFKNYEQYGITGMKLKYIPSNLVGTV